MGEFTSGLTLKIRVVEVAAVLGFHPARGSRRKGRVVEREPWSRPFCGIKDLLSSLPGVPGHQSQTLDVL